MTTDSLVNGYESLSSVKASILLRQLMEDSVRLVHKAPLISRDVQDEVNALSDIQNTVASLSSIISDSGVPANLQDILKHHAQERDGWKRGTAATIALLHHACSLVEKAEATIQSQNERIAVLENISMTDELTSLTNRRGFLAQFMQELDRCDRDISHGGLLILIDLDNFKSINDNHGHAAGDAALRLVARALSEEIRVMDVAARLGGDEFVLLLSNTTKTKASGRAQQLAWRLNNLSLAWYGDILPVRASMGLRAYGKGDKADMIFNGADSHLYANKALRKNGTKMQEEIRA